MGNGKIVFVDSLEDERWDRFVEMHPNGWIYHLSAWKLLLEKSFSHIKGFCIAQISNTNNEICAGLPIFEVNSFLTGKRLVSIPFGTLCDPLYYHEDDLRVIADCAIQLADSHKCSFIEIRSYNSIGVKKDERFKAHLTYKNHYLELNDDLESIKKRFHRTCVRQRITRSLKSGLRLKVGNSLRDLEQFYSLYLITRKRIRLPPMPFHFFKIMWELFQSSGKVSLLLAEHEETAIAALIMFKYKNRVSVEFAESDGSYKNLSPNHFLFWNAITISKAEGYSVFDFGRTSPENKELMAFKNHWGAHITDIQHYYNYRASKSDISFPEDRFTYSMVKAIAGFLPMSLYPGFGKMCYRHMG